MLKRVMNSVAWATKETCCRSFGDTFKHRLRLALSLCSMLVRKVMTCQIKPGTDYALTYGSIQGLPDVSGYFWKANGRRFKRCIISLLKKHRSRLEMPSFTGSPIWYRIISISLSLLRSFHGEKFQVIGLAIMVVQQWCAPLTYQVHLKNTRW